MSAASSTPEARHTPLLSNSFPPPRPLADRPLTGYRPLTRPTIAARCTGRYPAPDRHEAERPVVVPNHFISRLCRRCRRAADLIRILVTGYRTGALGTMGHCLGLNAW